MANFKIGDRVRRIKDIWNGMKPGDIATITGFHDERWLKLKEFPYNHDSNFFELVESKQEEQISESFLIFN